MEKKNSELNDVAGGWPLAQSSLLQTNFFRRAAFVQTSDKRIIQQPQNCTTSITMAEDSPLLQRPKGDHENTQQEQNPEEEEDQGMVEKIEEVLDEAKDIFIQDMEFKNEAVEEEGAFIMNMGMARNLGLLPGDAAQAAAAQEDTMEPHHGEHHHDEALMLPQQMPESPTYSSSLGAGAAALCQCQVLPETVNTMVHTLDAIEAPTADRMDHENEEETPVDPENPPPRMFSFKEQDHLHSNNNFRSGQSYHTYATVESDSSVSGPEGDHYREPKKQMEVEVTKDHHPHAEDDGEAGPPLQAYAILLFAIICLSMTGPFFNIQDGVGASMKIFWRTSCTNCILLPLAIRGCMGGNSSTAALDGGNGWPQLDSGLWLMVRSLFFSNLLVAADFLVSIKMHLTLLSYTFVPLAMYRFSWLVCPTPFWVCVSSWHWTTHPSATPWFSTTHRPSFSC